MFQYILARLVADRLNCSFVAKSNEKWNMQLGKHFLDAPLYVDRKAYVPRSPSITIWQYYGAPNPTLDLSENFVSKPKRVNLDDYFESSRYFLFRQEQMSETYWQLILTSNVHIVDHLRIADLVDRISNVPDYGNYVNAVSAEYPVLPIDLVVQSPEHPFAKECFDRLCSKASSTASMLWHVDAIDIFDCLRWSPILVATNSTMTWQCAFSGVNADIRIVISRRQPCALRNRGCYPVAAPYYFSLNDLGHGNYCHRSAARSMNIVRGRTS